MFKLGSSAQFLQLQYVCQLAICLYGCRQSYVAITNLRTYEETTKKLAKLSNEVDRQLWMTRKTQAAGAITCVLPLLSAAWLAIAPNSVPETMRMALPLTMLVIVLLSRHYIAGFWAPSVDKDGNAVGTKLALPMMEEYNKAVASTEEMLATLSYLEYSLLATSLVTFALPS